jgi:hypothetical protein
VLEPSCWFGGRRGTAPEAVDNGRGSTENGVAMKTLEALRDQTLHKLVSHYAVGDLRLGTLEHRVEQALTAESPSEVSGVTWDLPALESSIWERVKAHVPSPPSQAAATRIAFHALPEIDLALRGPRTWLIGRSSCCDLMLLDPSVSRRHALVSFRRGRCSVRDLASTNGVHVNGSAVETAILRPGDVLTIGSTVDAIVR